MIVIERFFPIDLGHHNRSIKMFRIILVRFKIPHGRLVMAMIPPERFAVRTSCIRMMFLD